ncbi:hypothetical protein [Tengunoibacter tsumagoiensis]|uniref:Uncharacterized protein n=1 Tax=Tengunoibacter tsumagoiensis TaxID=2014871 RepID=A0A401ZY81_9CHLR|nr:hypothetical protein [Tengunoibacter tsumagoiensis]GCE11801.1 hypothetical protein KTT_16600 [Tengunoibacter tsumagoiensis]
MNKNILLSEQTPDIQETQINETGFDEILFFSIFMALGSLVVYGLLALIEALSLLWSPLSIPGYLLLLVLSAFIMYVYLAEGDFTKHENSSFHLSMSLLCIIVTVVSFSQLSRQLALTLGGFAAAQNGYWHWLRFGISHLLDSALFNLPSDYNWNLSEIEPTNFWTRTYVFLYDLSVQIFVVAVVLQRLQFTRQHWSMRKTARYRTYFHYLLARARTWILLFVWGLPILFFLGVTANDGISLHGVLTTLKVGTPVVFTLWLLWYSLLALSLRGRWNRLLALGVSLACIGSLTFTFPAFVAFLTSH